MSGMDVDQIFVSGGKTQSTDEKINLSLDELVQQNRSNSKRKSNQKIRTTIREQGARRQQKFDNQRGLKANKPAGKAIIRNRANQILKNAIKRKQRGTGNGDVTPRRNRQNNNNNNDGNNNNNNNKNISPKKIFTKMGNRLNLQAKNRPSRPRTRAGEGWFEDRQGSNKNNGGVKINKPTDIKITVNNDRSNNKSNTVASRRSRGNDNNRNGNNRNDNNSNNNNGNNNNRNSRNGLTRQGLRISGGVQKRQGFVSDRLRNNKKNIRVRDNNNDNRNNNNNNNNNNSNNNNSNANKSSGNSARRRVVREPGTTSNSNSSSSTPSSTAPKTLSDRFAELRRKKNNNNNNSNNNAGNSKRRIIRRQ